MANRFTPPEKLLPARAKRSLVKPIRWSPQEWERIENAAQRAGETPVELVRRRVLTGLKAAALVVIVASASCTAANFRERAVQTAASEHRCPAAKIKTIVAEDRMHWDFSYWMDVCGSERLYRMDATTGDRFADQTASTR